MKNLKPDLCDELNPDFTFRLIWTELLCRIAKGEVNSQEIAMKELRNRGLDINGKWIGFDKKNVYPTEPMDELTDKMHSTFTISDEDDRKHRVWCSMNLEAEGDYSIEEALEMQQVTMEDYFLYADTYPDPDEE